MKRSGSRIFLLFSISIVFCVSFQPIIAGINIGNNQEVIIAIDKDSALLVACAKLKNLEKNIYTIVSSDEILDDSGYILCYVFNLNPQGYIVVSAYKTLPPVLAYSFTSSFSKTDAIIYDLIKADISLRLSHYSEISENIKKENMDLWNYYLGYDSLVLEDDTVKQWPRQGLMASGGWLETKWHQNSPFNDFCPIDLATGDRSVAGCPAVAMAQILNYHRTTNNIQFNDSDDYHHLYSGNNFWIDDDYETYDFPSFPQLNSYLDALVFNYKNDLPITDENKAALVFACGVAAKQAYSSSVSGTFGVNQAYNAYKRFSFYDCELLDDEPDLYERVQDNIINGLPVHLAVVDAAWQHGHNLVIDGYRSDGYYHLNFGWRGSYNGWYKLPEELPYNLDIIEGVIVDIINDNSYSDLHSEGTLYWPAAKIGTTVEGVFTIENVGAPGLEINWEVKVWPDWGKWSFDPSSGVGLTPESGSITINVSVDLPVRIKKHFNGLVKVVDINNNTNSCLIHVSLSTKLTRNNNLNLNPFFQRYLFALHLFRFLLNQ